MLALAVLFVFGETFHHDFVNFDDGVYIYDNPQIQRGLSADGIGWAFTTRHSANWHPLTWLSHSLDWRLFGPSAGGHHAMSVLLHAATVVLLFLALRRMTGEVWPAALAAALFAVHPLRVESVAWAAERKDVLSGLFFMLTLWAYANYVGRPASLWRYLLVVAAMACGLMAKPMLITLPFVLLLLDYWPLGRFDRAIDARRGFLFVEKIPLFVLAAASCAATLWAESIAVDAARGHISLSARLGNAAVSYVAYLGQSLWPTGLAVLYPHPGDTLPTWQIAASLLVLAAITAGAIVVRRRMPFLAVGWFWYLGMLVPVIGLVQVGSQARADRYTYLPQIGLCIAAAWSVRAAILAWPRRRTALVTASVAAVVVLLGSAYHQVGYWRNSETLWTHAIECTSANSTAHYNLAQALSAAGRPAEAAEQYEKSLDAKPDYADAANNLGLVLNECRRTDDAIAAFRRALKIRADFAEAHNNLANVLGQRGRIDEALAEFNRAIAIQPDYAGARCGLGNALAAAGRTDEAIAAYRQALKLRPDMIEAHNNLGAVLAGQGKIDEAIAEFRAALAIRPDYVDSRRNLNQLLLEQKRNARNAK